MDKNKIILKDNQQSNANAYRFVDTNDKKPDDKQPTTFPEKYWDYMKGLSDINDLLENNKLIVIPQKDSYQNSDIFKRINDSLYTYNWVGVISKKTDEENDFRVEIRSRFDKGEKQYFLLYLLCNVSGLNVFDFSVNSESESDFTAILVLLFLMKLSEAYNEGLYKEYVTNKYNDFSFKGSFDVQRHILLNNPFVGKTAYSVREYSYDNDILCLLRQTLDYIIDTYPDIWEGYDSQSTVLRDMTGMLETATPSYRMNENYAERIKCQREITSPLYRDYEDARRLALMILRGSGQNIFDNKDEESDGILIDVAWLWEEFISVTMLKDSEYTHLLTDGSKGALKWAKGESWYPDFIEKKHEGERRRIFDAKYKFWKWGNQEDVHQVLSYLFLSGGDVCGIIYPSEDNELFEVKELNAYKDFYEKSAKIYKMPLYIPKSEGIDFQTYSDKMDESIRNWRDQFSKI